MDRHQPALPDGTDHDDHDRLLIARSLDGGLDAVEMSQAERLIQSCPGCASLVGDLHSISTAVAHMPAARRTRDFRITAAQAAAARGSALTRLLRGVGLLPGLDPPRRQIMQPLAGAAIAIGLVLVVIGSGWPSTGPAGPGGSAGTAATHEGPVTAAGATSDTPESAPPPRTSQGGAVEVGDDASPVATIGPDVAPFASDSQAEPDRSVASQDPISEGSGPSPTPLPRATEAVDPTATLPPNDTAVLPSQRPTPAPVTTIDDASARPGGDTGVAVVGLALAGVGVLLLLLRPIARRLEGR